MEELLKFDDMTNKTKNKVSNLESGLNKDAEKIKRLEIALKEIENKFDEAQSIAQYWFLGNRPSNSKIHLD